LNGGPRLPYYVAARPGTVQGIRRTHAPQQTVRRVQPAVTAVMYKLVDQLGDSPLDKRDRALLLIGFAGAFKGDPTHTITVLDIAETEDGLRIRLRQSKTDQEAEGSSRYNRFGAEYKTAGAGQRAWKNSRRLA